MSGSSKRITFKKSKLTLQERADLGLVVKISNITTLGNT